MIYVHDNGKSNTRYIRIALRFYLQLPFDHESLYSSSIQLMYIGYIYVSYRYRYIWYEKLNFASLTCLSNNFNKFLMSAQSLYTHPRAHTRTLANSTIVFILPSWQTHTYINMNQNNNRNRN